MATVKTVGKLSRQAGRAVGRIPVAVVLGSLMWVTGAATGSIAVGPSPVVRTAAFISPDGVDEGNWWPLLSTVPFPGGLASYLLATAVLLLGVGLAETAMGSGRALAAFGFGHIASLFLYLFVVSVGDDLGSSWLSSMDHPALAGPFAGSFAAAMAASPVIDPLWRRRLVFLCLAVTVMPLLYVGHPQNLLAFLGFLCGLILGRAMKGAAHARPAGWRSRDIRSLLAMVVAVFAAGPLLAGLSQAPTGPLAVFRNLIINPVPSESDLLRNCGAAVNAGCSHVMHSAGLNGPGGVALSVVPLLLLLACGEGLRRGSRTALWIAASAHLTVGVISAVYLQLFAHFGVYVRNGRRRIPVDSGIAEILPVVLVPLVIAAVLILSRRHFAVDTEPMLGRRLLLVVPGVFGMVVAAYVVAWFAEGNDRRRAGLLALGATLPRMFLPYPFSFRYSVSVHPRGYWSTLIFSYGGAAFWFTCLAAALLAFTRRRLLDRRTETERSLARRLVFDGGGSLSWMALWANNRYWFDATGTVGIAYQVHHGVALTAGGPFGDGAHVPDALREFTRHCAVESLTPCWYSVSEPHRNELRALGFKSVAVAEEFVLPLDGLKFRGKDWQGVRTAMNRARELGITARWGTCSDMPPTLRDQVREISKRWVAARSLPEMGFTLGGLDQLKDEQVLLCLAVDPGGRVHGVTSWLPVYRRGVVVSRTLDFMRRGEDGFNGVMQFLIASAVLYFKDTMEEVSLSGCPLVSSTAAAEDGAALSRFLAWLSDVLEPVYGFRSLAEFKQRFRPRHRALYLLYQDPLALPQIFRALLDAYIPGLSPRQTARMLREITGAARSSERPSRKQGLAAP